jgi:hypothetical protein
MKLVKFTTQYEIQKKTVDEEKKAFEQKRRNLQEVSCNS